MEETQKYIGYSIELLGGRGMVDKYIKQALESDYIVSIPIEKLNNDETKELVEKAKENKILVTMKAEYSNIHQGILISLVRKSIVNDSYIRWL